MTTNDGFETGDTTGWTYFPSVTSTFNVSGDSNTGSFAGELFNDTFASAAVIKQANIGIGTVNPGDQIDISFSIKGSTAVGGVVFAEFFSEVSGGGVSSSEILGGGPIFPTPTYQNFSFTTTAGPDVSGGVTLQFVAATGGATGSSVQLIVDDVSVSVIPEPTSAALIMGLLTICGFVSFRRLKKH